MLAKKDLRKLSKNELIDLLLKEREARQLLEKGVNELERQLRFFINPHTPSSKQPKSNTEKNTDSISEKEKKPRFPGKPPKSKGGGIEIPPVDEVVEHKLEKEPETGLPLGNPIGYRTKIVIDFPDKPIGVIEHRIMKYQSPSTGKIIEAKVDLPNGIYGKNIQSVVVILKYLNLSNAKIACFIKELGAKSFSSAEVQNITEKVSNTLKTEKKKIHKEILTELYMHGDETQFRCDGKNGYIWGIFTKKRAIFLASMSRARANFLALIKKFKGVMVTDGYNAYDEYPKRHRCWSHLKRDFKDSAIKDKEIEIQYNRFVKHYKYVQELKEKEDREGIPIEQKTIDYTIWLFGDILTCLKTNKKARSIRTLIENGGEDWFTALYYPGVPLDNNLAERGLRPLVLLKKIIGCYRNEKGKRWIEVAFSVLYTWKLQGKSLFSELKPYLS